MHHTMLPVQVVVWLYHYDMRVGLLLCATPWFLGWARTIIIWYETCYKKVGSNAIPHHQAIIQNQLYNSSF